MEHTEVVLERLEGIYGETNAEAGFAGRIREIAGRIAEDCYKELALDMEYLKEGSFLEEFDDLNVEVRIRETLADSIAYTVLKRCGMEESELAEEIDFPYIHEFNTVETLSQLGSSVSDLSKPILMEIGKAIGVYEREKAQNLEPKNLGEKGLENTSETRYNALKRESESKDGEFITQTGEAGERSQKDESDIREERGLSDTDVTDRRTAGGDAHEVRTDEEEILTGEQERVYTGLLLKGKLKEHLLSIQEQAEQRMELLTGQMKEKEGVTEQLKAENQMLWVQKMNNIRHSAEEIVLTELIYS